MSNLSSHDPLRADEQEQAIKALRERNAELEETLLQTQRELGNMRGFRDRALSELAEPRKDTERLNWLDGDNWWDFCRSANPKEPDKTFHIDIGEGENCNSLSGASARKAIDAARAAIPENGATGAK